MTTNTGGHSSHDSSSSSNSNVNLVTFSQNIFIVTVLNSRVAH